MPNKTSGSKLTFRLYPRQWGTFTVGRPHNTPVPGQDLSLSSRKPGCPTQALPGWETRYSNLYTVTFSVRIPRESKRQNLP
jgi:hypothetical protein